MLPYSNVAMFMHFVLKSAFLLRLRQISTIQIKSARQILLSIVGQNWRQRVWHYNLHSRLVFFGDFAKCNQVRNSFTVCEGYLHWSVRERTKSRLFKLRGNTDPITKMSAANTEGKQDHGGDEVHGQKEQSGVKDGIDELINQERVVIFSKSTCPYCDDAKKVHERITTRRICNTSVSNVSWIACIKISYYPMSWRYGRKSKKVSM